MSQSITVALPAQYDRAFFEASLAKQAKHRGLRLSHFETQLQLDTPGLQSYLTVREFEDREGVVEDYSTDDELDAEFRDVVQFLRFFEFTFHGFDLAKEVLAETAAYASERGVTIWFDMGYGYVIRADDFMKEIQKNPCWDWRSRR